MPEVKPPKAEKDISEPVLSFVKCVLKNPKRFKVIYDFEHYEYVVNKGLMEKDKKPTTYVYSLTDMKTGESWVITKDRSYFSCYPVELEATHTINPEWLTEDEREYLIESIKVIFHNRKDRKLKLEQIRKERRIRDERNRLKDIYK